MRGEPWTIKCLELSGPDHQTHATAIADVLRGTDGIDPEKVRVRHADDGSRVYYGRYLRRIDRLRGIRDIPEALRRDLEMIKELYDDRGRRALHAQEGDQAPHHRGWARARWGGWRAPRPQSPPPTFAPRPVRRNRV